MNTVNEGASLTDTGRRFHSAVVLGKNEYLKQSLFAESLKKDIVSVVRVCIPVLVLGV